MKKDSVDDYEILSGKHFVLRFYNPSPGNPELKHFDFDEEYVYTEWLDSSKTKTKIDRIEQKYDEDKKDLEIGVVLWMGRNYIFLSKVDEDEDFYDYDDFNNDEDYEEDEEESEEAGDDFLPPRDDYDPPEDYDPNNKDKSGPPDEYK
jgi:hypothetical protein